MRTAGHAGRISKDALQISTSVLMGIVTIALITRYYIRIRLQSGLSVDDALLAIAYCCVLVAFILLYAMALEDLFLVEALLKNVANVRITPDVFQRFSELSNTWITTILLSCWISIVAVKFSFLLFFRKLIDRVRPLVLYWWFVVIFNIAVLAFGCAVYFVSCPHKDVIGAVSCVSGPLVHRVMAFSIAQIVLDIISDLLILSLPLHLISHLHLPALRKLHISLSLCLTAILILVTIIRVAGFKDHGVIDVVWETYWFLVSAQVGVLVGAASSFRSLFVVRGREKETERTKGKEKGIVYAALGSGDRPMRLEEVGFERSRDVDLGRGIEDER